MEVGQSSNRPSGRKSHPATFMVLEGILLIVGLLMTFKSYSRAGKWQTSRPYFRKPHQARRAGRKPLGNSIQNSETMKGKA